MEEVWDSRRTNQEGRRCRRRRRNRERVEAEGKKTGEIDRNADQSNAPCI